MQSSVVWHCGNSHGLLTSAGAATTERPVLVRLALRPRLRIGHLFGTRRRFRVRPHLRRPHAVFGLVPAQGRVEDAVVYAVLRHVALL